jgi:hypothetical protein
LAGARSIKGKPCLGSSPLYAAKFSLRCVWLVRPHHCFSLREHSWTSLAVILVASAVYRYRTHI